ncbi:MAG: mucoidy inhibitor MuiA family protein [bacterium]|nr:mucoidy inhibitor MuiA family protein [bacterium]
MKNSTVFTKTKQTINGCCLIFLFLVFLVSGFPGNLIPAADTPAGGIRSYIVKSKISEVTVFVDRARVTRKTSVSLPKGNHTLVFKLAPEADNTLDIESIRVRAYKGDFRIAAVKHIDNCDYFQKYLENDKKWSQKQLLLKNQIKSIDNKIKEAKKAGEFIDKIIRKITQKQENNQSNPNDLNPENWIKMYDFYCNKNEALNKQLLDAEIRKVALEKEIDTLEKEINESQTLGDKLFLNVEVLVANNTEGQVVLGLSYNVKHARWSPVYDLHVASSTKKIKLAYTALIWQNTGEDWNHARIKLSTARTDTAAQHPLLKPVSASLITLNKSGAKTTKSLRELGFDMDRINLGGSDSGKQVLGVIDPSWRSPTSPLENNLKNLDAALLAEASSLTFALPDKYSVKSDNKKLRVTIMKRHLNAYFRYSAIPKLDLRAYLKAKVENSSNYALLPGNADVFLNKNLVSQSLLKYVSPGEVFWVYLGADDDIKIDYKFMHKEKGKKNFLSKKNVLDYDNLFTVTNNKKEEVEVVIWDQVPLPADQKIKINFIAPKFDKTTDGTEVIKTKYNLIEWRYNLKPYEKKKIPFKYSVEYPKDHEIKIKK